jgi:hypothetical protein
MWSSRVLQNGDISYDQYKYVTQFDNCHPDVPKPLFKTNKMDEEGKTLDPVPKRTLTL